MTNNTKQILALDFDGVVHQYSKGWQDGAIYDDVTPGFFDWALAAADHFRLVIYSSRSKTDEGKTAMREWLSAQSEKWRAERDHPPVTMLTFEFAHEKPPAWLTIDDRAFCFSGDWSDPILSVEALKAFKPWMQGPWSYRQNTPMEKIINEIETERDRQQTVEGHSHENDDPRCHLIRAAALIVAEIERLDRASNTRGDQ